MNIQEKLVLILNTKNEIRNAIKYKGVECLDSDPFSTYPKKILSIQSGEKINTNSLSMLDMNAVNDRLRFAFGDRLMFIHYYSITSISVEVKKITKLSLSVTEG